VKTEEKKAIDKDRRLVQQFQEGLSTVNEIIKGAKE